MNLQPHPNTHRQIDPYEVNVARPHREIYIDQFELEYSDAEFLMYSNPSKSMLENLEATRRLPFFKRVFRSLDQGSLRQTALALAALPAGLGVCLAPYCVAQWGLFLGVAVLCLAALVTYWSVNFMFEAQSCCRDKRPMEVVKKLLPTWLGLVFRVTLLAELFLTPTLAIILFWKLFCFMLLVNGKGFGSWAIDLFSLRFNNYDLSLFVARIAYLHLLFILLLVFFFKSNIRKFGKVCLAHFGLIGLLLLIVVVHAHSDYMQTHYPSDPVQKTEAQWAKQPLGLFWARNLFVPLLMYHSYSQAPLIRNWVILPSLPRLRKITRISLASQCALYTLVGFVGYYVWGDRYVPVLIFLREQLGLSLLYQSAAGLLIVMLLVNVVFLNIGLRNTLIQLSIQRSTFDQAARPG